MSLPLSTELADKRVLIAEDDVLIAMLAESVVRDLGGESAGCANSCEKALAMLQEQRPDILLLDVNLGGRTSEPVLQAALDRNVPVLISSGSDGEALPEPFRDLPLLAKPWTTHDFAVAANLLLPAQNPAGPEEASYLFISS